MLLFVQFSLKIFKIPGWYQALGNIRPAQKMVFLSGMDSNDVFFFLCILRDSPTRLSLLCPKSNLNVGIKTGAAKAWADSTVHVWLLGFYVSRTKVGHTLTPLQQLQPWICGYSAYFWQIWSWAINFNVGICHPNHSRPFVFSLQYEKFFPKPCKLGFI